MAEGAREELGVLRMCRFVNEISLFMKFCNSIFLIYWLLFLLASCSVSRQISKQAEGLLNDSAVSKGFTGISIYEPFTGKYWYNYNATKYFTPASNTKLFSLYAGMKYLGDSLAGLKYQYAVGGGINIFPTADPTFLHPDFEHQTVLDFLMKEKGKCYYSDWCWNEKALGFGWAWDDYNDDYMVERSSFPVYGNIIRLKYGNLQFSKRKVNIEWKAIPPYFSNNIDSINSYSLLQRNPDSVKGKTELLKFYVKRDWEGNTLRLIPASSIFTYQEIPFHTENNSITVDILNKDFSLEIRRGKVVDTNFPLQDQPLGKTYMIHSQPSDSLFRPMMHRSDNFFAEQTLLMVSNERLGNMNDEAIIDTLLRSDLKDIPQRPKWVDGSGLSRYNLFTPQSFIYILNKLYTEFGLKRLKSILPTGGEGTLKSFYTKDSGFIYAKTGTLSNNCSLSGFLITNRGKLLIFSILANHYQSSATLIRRATERFLTDIRRKY